MNMSLFLCIMFPTILIFCSYLYMTKIPTYWKKRDVREKHRFLCFLNFLKYFFRATSPDILIQQLYNESNHPYVGFYSFDKPCLLVRDPEIMRKMFITDFVNFTDKFMQSSKKDTLSNQSLPFLKNIEWKFWRTILTSAFSPGKLRNVFREMQVIKEEADKYLESIKLDGSGNEIEIKEFLAQYTTEIVGLTTYGIKLNSFHPGAVFRKFGKRMFGDYGWRRSNELSSVFFAPHMTNFLGLFDFRFFEKVSGDFFKKEFIKILKDREASKIKRGDFADLLLEIKQTDSVSFDQIISQAVAFFTAGFDTTSTVTSYSLKELAANLEIQTKLRGEIIGAMQGTNEIAYEMIKNLSYLEMVVLETLRLHPTVPTIDRICTRDYTIEQTGLVIEKGTPIFISPPGLHHDPKYFRNPEVFDPERFSKENNGSRNSAYMPFGIGPRKCIASQLGLMQVKYIIAHLISKYEVTPSSTPRSEVNSKVYFTAGKGDIYLNVRKI